MEILGVLWLVFGLPISFVIVLPLVFVIVFVALYIIEYLCSATYAFTEGGLWGVITWHKDRLLDTGLAVYDTFASINR